MTEPHSFFERTPGWLSLGVNEVGQPTVTLTSQQAAAVAALCLHGRITWEMVDALRFHGGIRIPEGVHVRPEGCGYLPDPHLAALADLLESLLPLRSDQ